MPMNTASVSLAVTPTVVSTLLTHYLNRKPLRQRPTAHLSYDEGLHLIRSFLKVASHHTVEELQAFTSQWVPHPQWIKVEEVKVPEDQLVRAASLLQEQLGPDGVRKVGGRKWWQWRKPNSPLKAEWIEMRSDYHERKRSGERSKRVMLYVHGGAYFFGSVDEHRYQLQRHARKLKARVIAPKYRLAPQFPFPCGLQDVLATYLHLLASGQEPSTIVLAGDSAGGGMVLSALITLRDRGIPLPAGAVLISPWVDLTHSFPSVAAESAFDYIPAHGFHHKPSESWPPPTKEQLQEMKALTLTTKAKNETSDVTEVTASVENEVILSVAIEGKAVEVHEQIQMYTTNELLSHPLVSPIMQPTLGGLPPLFIMVGGGEMLRDEQIYLAHKCADPNKYLPAESLMNNAARASLKQFKPTDVHLQVWDDLCHVAPTLSFTRPAKYMYRSIAQFGAWALARAQRTEIDILDDDDISVISSSGSDSDEPPAEQDKPHEGKEQGQIGKAGDPLPPFKNHMIRQRVTRHGTVFPLAPASELPSCRLHRDHIGSPKEGPVAKWLAAKKQWSTKYSGTHSRVHKKRLKAVAVGYETFGDGEYPPPSALAGRRRIGADLSEKKKTRSMGMSLWSLWGSKHDEMTVSREEKADRQPDVKTTDPAEGANARSFADIQRQDAAPKSGKSGHSRSRSRRRIVRDENQVEQNHDGGRDKEKESSGVGSNADAAVAQGSITPVAELLAQRREREAQTQAQAEAEAATRSSDGLLTPDYVPETGAAGKRPFMGGISVPFTLKKEAETASMMTLNSAAEPSTGHNPRPMSPAAMSDLVNDKEDRAGEAAATRADSTTTQDMDATPLSPAMFETPLASPGSGRPPLEKFVTADEDLPKAQGD